MLVGILTEVNAVMVSIKGSVIVSCHTIWFHWDTKIHKWKFKHYYVPEEDVTAAIVTKDTHTTSSVGSSGTI